MRATNPLWRAPDHQVSASPTHAEEPQTFTSSSSPTRGWGSPLRHRLTILASAAALSIAGLLAVTVPAYADALIQIDDSADPVPVNTSYDYNVTIPALAIDVNFVSIDIGGATATFTGVTSSNATLPCSISGGGTHVQCQPTGPVQPGPTTITATVLPTAAGIVTADAVLNGGMGHSGSDSETTEITDSTPPGCTITGTAGNDTLTGTNGNDVICGLGGDDTITGGNGDDTIYGGPGNDTLTGGNGEDTLIDTSGTDTLNGSNGIDHINVQDNTAGDTANGGNGDDICTVDSGDITISC